MAYQLKGFRHDFNFDGSGHDGETDSNSHRPASAVRDLEEQVAIQVLKIAELQHSNNELMATISGSAQNEDQTENDRLHSWAEVSRLKEKVATQGARIQELQQSNKEMTTAVTTYRQQSEKLAAWLTQVSDQQGQFSAQADTLLARRHTAGEPLGPAENFISIWALHFKQVLSTESRLSVDTLADFSDDGNQH